MRSTIITLSLVAQLVGAPTSNGASAMDVQGAATRAHAGDVDPCTFFSKAELEKAFGASFGPPKPKENVFAGPSCMFYSTVTGTISIRAGEAVGRAQFDSLPMMLREAAERVSGLGESAFIYNRALHVLNNGHQLVVGVSGEMTPRIRAALLTLGRLGAPRLLR